MFVCLWASQRLPEAIASKVQGVVALLLRCAKCSVWKSPSHRPATRAAPACFFAVNEITN